MDRRGTLVLVVSGVLAISALHYITPPPLAPWHVIFIRLYFLPILLAALEFGWESGLATALISGVICYVPHFTVWSHYPGYTDYSQYGEIVVFAVVGTVTGVLASRGRESTRQLSEHTQQLQQAHQELRENLAHIKRADRLAATGRLAAGLAPEMQQPLAAMEQAVRDLDCVPQIPAARLRVLNGIRRECRKWDRLLSQLLDFSKPHGTRVRMVDVSKIVDSVTLLLAPIAQGEGVSLLKSVEPGLPPVECEAEHIEQALLNVAMSSINVVERGATVTLAACRTGSNVALEVRMEHRPAESNLEFASAGTELLAGLCVARQILIEHGGSLVTDTSTGSPQRILLCLPCEQVSASDSDRG